MFKIAAIVLVIAATIPATANADQNVSGYTRSDGTYVQGYTRSSPDNSYNNNYSVQGNTNPYTGRAGTNSPTYNDQTPYENRRDYGNPGYVRNDPYDR